MLKEGESSFTSINLSNVIRYFVLPQLRFKIYTEIVGHDRNTSLKHEKKKTWVILKPSFSDYNKYIIILIY